MLCFVLMKCPTNSPLLSPRIEQFSWPITTNARFSAFLPVMGFEATAKSKKTSTPRTGTVKMSTKPIFHVLVTPIPTQRFGYLDTK